MPRSLLYNNICYDVNTTSYTGDLKLKTEVGGLFGRRSTIPVQSPPSTTSSGESLLARADSLCKQLRAGKMMNMHANTRQKANANGIKQSYRNGAIYIRLNSDILCKSEQVRS